VNTEANLSVYPNPANDILNIDITQVRVEGATVELIDLTGKVIISREIEDIFQEGGFQLNVGGVANGVYIARFTSGDAVSTTKVTVSH
jgi:hypothetical protein